ncbi:MAG TPA: lysophospholipid acyltransferase family protein [Candidatus Bathyarchaeia archaeon]|nr:lysophospholipid acyltransferase family protein [Candidatus Bathyarchaeia archaeon]
MRAAGKPPRPARVRSITKIQTAAAGSLAEARQRPMVVQRFDLFRERLRALESRVELAVIESGAIESGGSRITDALEALLDGYARLARGLEEGSLAGLVRRLRSRAHVAGVDDFGYDREFEQVVAPLFRALYRTWWRVETRGIEHVRASGRVLMVANHAGGMFAYDGAMLKVALLDEHPAHREVRPLVDDFVYNLPYVGTFMTRCGGVRASPENADRLLKRDEAVVVFPEGTKGIGKAYRDRYRLARFGRGGFVRIALRTGAPVVPVAIVGSEEIHPIVGRWDWLARLLGLPYFPLTPTFPWLGVLGLLPLPSKWRIEFGRPLDWSDRYGPEAAKDRLLVSRLTEEVRQQVQRLLAEAIERRGPAFF